VHVEAASATLPFVGERRGLESVQRYADRASPSWPTDATVGWAVRVLLMCSVAGLLLAVAIWYTVTGGTDLLGSEIHQHQRKWLRRPRSREPHRAPVVTSTKGAMSIDAARKRLQKSIVALTKKRRPRGS
jgi:hypothetical protein